MLMKIILLYLKSLFYFAFSVCELNGIEMFQYVFNVLSVLVFNFFVTFALDKYLTDSFSALTAHGIYNYMFLSGYLFSRGNWTSCFVLFNNEISMQWYWDHKPQFACSLSDKIIRHCLLIIYNDFEIKRIVNTNTYIINIISVMYRSNIYNLS